MTTEEQIEIMQAYVDGKTIQTKSKHRKDGWEDFVANRNPYWTWETIEYRVKPEPKYRPLKPEELIELKGKWLHIGTECNMITRICINRQRVWFGDFWRDAEYLLQFCLYENKQPVGILE